LDGTINIGAIDGLLYATSIQRNELNSRKTPRQISRRQARPVSASTLTVKTSLAPVADELVRVQHAGVAFRLPSEYLMEVAMILVQRSVSVAPGMLSAAMAFANEIATQVKATTGVDVKIAVPVGGNAARMAWISNYEDLTHYETSARKLLNDQKYMEVIEKAAGIYVANTLHDEIWRTL
jgi:hypothetical protein